MDKMIIKGIVNFDLDEEIFEVIDTTNKNVIQPKYNMNEIFKLLHGEDVEITIKPRNFKSKEKVPQQQKSPKDWANEETD